MKRKSSPCRDADQPMGGAARLAFSIDEIVQLTSLGRTTIYKLIAENQLTLIKVGRRSLVTVDAWQKCVDQLSKKGVPNE